MFLVKVPESMLVVIIASGVIADDCTVVIWLVCTSKFIIVIGPVGHIERIGAGILQPWLSNLYHGCCFNCKFCYKRNNGH